ncbi:hypothetical protein [Serpentinicella alkaliphila]|uniref:Uncharacterized protein n=1 Tax=Serpentinicella alkaliphila TaxID=1734049 RepID=A0A4R2TP59_9FIRM|nr:hypothetical protein [Serpentinicella alkaliphila]QUH24665.1 hypothetical protein HZR23_01885 [Serpentinicella alkaliphila]TCQ03075.1 hypothetical protein EDD79_101138 [Serpentinicella alkaliphila]
MKGALIKIAKELNEKQILWALGGSLVLKHYNLVGAPKDIDIFVHEKDLDSVIKVMETMGENTEVLGKGLYTTKYFYKYVVNNVNVDIMSGFGIRHEAGIFNYNFDETSIVDRIKYREVNIPLTSLEDWFVIYQLIPNRDEKVELIEQYFNSVGNVNKNVLGNYLEYNLPSKVKERIVSLIKE